MTIKQSHRRFAEVYVETGGDRRAAVAASNSRAKNWSNAASKILVRPEVQAYITELNSKAGERAAEGAEDTRQTVLALIDETIEIARRGVPVLGKNGQPATDPYTHEVIFKPDVSGMQRGAELKGKTIAMFTDVTKHTSEMEGKSVAELTGIIEAALSDPMILEQVARMESVREKVHELDRRAAGSGTSPEGDEAPQAEPLSPAPQAIGPSTGRVH